MSEDERQRLVRDAVVNNLSMVVSAIVGFLLVPFMLTALGQDNYGLWVVASAVMGIFLTVDLGLGWSLTRVVAADPVGIRQEDVDFVRSAANVYLLLGLAGCIVIGSAGFLASDRLRLSPVRQDTTAWLFWLIGLVFCAERTGTAGSAVLSGLRRYSLLNTITSLYSLVWAAGAVAVLTVGGGIIAVVACQLLVTLARSITLLWFASRYNPLFRCNLFFLRPASLRRHISFALSSQITNLLGSITCNAGPMLLGFISGPAAAVPFSIGQKLPLMVSSMAWRAAEVLFPAASAHQHNDVKSAEVLQVGSRAIIIGALPLNVVLFVAGPEILQAWLGSPPRGSVAVLRIMAAAMIADAVMVVPLYVLWGRGTTRPILLAYTVLGTGVVALTGALIPSLGASGAAWGMLLPLAAVAVLLAGVAARECKVGAGKVSADTWRGLLLPVMACVLCVSVLTHFWHGKRLSAIASVTVGVLSYAVVLGGFSGSDEEKRTAKTVLYRAKAGALLVLQHLRVKKQ
jgi:O-antigen/teichoic acid export membrane protein